MKPTRTAVEETPADKRRRIAGVLSRNLDPTTIKFRQEPEHVVIPPKELDQLKIDLTYQRRENRSMVNELVAVLEAGGKVPDPITVVQRPNGDRYIVDGQQRWAAHYLSEKPLQAIIYHLTSLDDERRLFSILNNTVRPHVNVRMRAWTGPGGDLLRRLNDDATGSPLSGRISFSAGGNGAFSASTITQGVLAALGGSIKSRDAESIMRALDAVVRPAPARAWRVAVAYCNLLTLVFGASGATTRRAISRLGAIAMGAAAHRRWHGHETLTTPSKGSLHRLRITNWEELVPTSRDAWLEPLTAEVLKRWKD